MYSHTNPYGLVKYLSIIAVIISSSFGLFGQNIPSHSVLENEEILKHIRIDLLDEISDSGEFSEKKMASYFRLKFSEGFFYDYKNLQEKFDMYESKYGNRKNHIERAEDHMSKYPDSTQWKLPFNYQNGVPVNAYALRHLARQHKMVDIAFKYFYSDKDPQYVHYFINQQASLNDALHAGNYERIADGNGVYESFRAGYRVLNWLTIHNMFLGEEAYDDHAQLRTIATLLQHGALLYENNDQFRSGNHQTRGVSALAMLAIIFNEFEDSALWFERAMKRLGEHLDREINQDGFQFERSVHYHMSDINNYFYVYQLAKLNNAKISEAWTDKLNTLFSTLVKIAYPNRKAPVLQDDTEIPWAEYNEIGGIMTLGYLLFENPQYGYFAEDKVNGFMYWFLNRSDIETLENIKSSKPKYGSLFFPNTHYYIMREGWNKNDKMLVISAGVDSIKPDHQHGDILGIQAYAYGQVLLPNYQVRYSLEDFALFKNSLVKNVALVDDQLQGKEWRSNKGGSGFGKFGDLPNPEIVKWKSTDDYDLFSGKHDGFQPAGINYSRQVIYVKDDFWIVTDNFNAENNHDYKQVWQGHYTHEEGPNLIRSTFPDAVGLDIYQLNLVDNVESSGARGKEWSIVSKKARQHFDFITVLFPYKNYSNRIDEEKDNPSLKSWKSNKLPFAAKGETLRSLNKNNKSFLFNCTTIRMEGVLIEFDEPADVFVEKKDTEILIHSLDVHQKAVKLEQDGQILLNGKKVLDRVIFQPGDEIIIK